MRKSLGFCLLPILFFLAIPMSRCCPILNSFLSFKHLQLVSLSGSLHSISFLFRMLSPWLFPLIQVSVQRKISLPFLAKIVLQSLSLPGFIFFIEFIFPTLPSFLHLSLLPFLLFLHPQIGSKMRAGTLSQSTFHSQLLEQCLVSDKCFKILTGQLIE